MTDQCQILISSAEYHILVYLVNSGETEKCSFLVRLKLVWHELNLAIKSFFPFFQWMHLDYQFSVMLCFRCLKYTIKICFINPIWPVGVQIIPFHIKDVIALEMVMVWTWNVITFSKTYLALLMSALFSETTISTQINGFILFMQLELFSHVNLSKSLL